MTHPDVKIYSSKFCGYCVAAERLFTSKGVSYQLIKVDEDPEMFRVMTEATGRRTVPQIFIGEHHVGGFDDLSAINQSGELDSLLNPS
jgi:glutaredoxin 3